MKRGIRRQASALSVPRRHQSSAGGRGTATTLRRLTSYLLLYSLTHYQERGTLGADIRVRCVTPSGKYQAKASELQSQGGWLTPWLSISADQPRRRPAHRSLCNL